jgi:hypothetical protein
MFPKEPKPAELRSRARTLNANTAGRAGCKCMDRAEVANACEEYGAGQAEGKTAFGNDPFQGGTNSQHGEESMSKTPKHAGLDGRSRNEDGEIRKKRIDTLVGTLRQEYGEDFTKGAYTGR